jgi:hypothetical protein
MYTHTLSKAELSNYVFAVSREVAVFVVWHNTLEVLMWVNTNRTLRLTSELEVTAPSFKTLKWFVMTDNRKIIACATFS